MDYSSAKLRDETIPSSVHFFLMLHGEESSLVESITDPVWL